MRLFAPYLSLCRWLAKITAVLLGVALTSMFFCVGIQVFVRSLLSMSVLWLDDILMSCFVVAIFSGIALGFRFRSHLATTIIVEGFGELAARVFGHLVDLLCVISMAGVAWYGIEFAESAFGQFTPVLRLPLGWVYLIIPVSAAISILFILENQLVRKDPQHD
ncbi:TRAP transporter small permease [Cohaesibacter marisflavi]|uniref:TRAP transporter small permease n=1 Tax=Cohaesibacter marisflavi TaxID=655353 RepID=UPI0029C943E4|nr:TRAP transporter small permease [Cohaesibacter marisflavi]